MKCRENTANRINQQYNIHFSDFKLCSRNLDKLNLNWRKKLVNYHASWFAESFSLIWFPSFRIIFNKNVSLICLISKLFMGRFSQSLALNRLSHVYIFHLLSFWDALMKMRETTANRGNSLRAKSRKSKYPNCKKFRENRKNVLFLFNDQRLLRDHYQLRKPSIFCVPQWTNLACRLRQLLYFLYWILRCLHLYLKYKNSEMAQKQTDSLNTDKYNIHTISINFFGLSNNKSNLKINETRNISKGRNIYIYYTYIMAFLGLLKSEQCLDSLGRIYAPRIRIQIRTFILEMDADPGLENPADSYCCKIHGFSK